MLDKGLYQLPEGDPEEPVHVDLPESVTTESEDGSVVVDFSESSEKDGDISFTANLAEHMEDGDLAELAGELIADFDSDLHSRADWEKIYVEGIELLGLGIEERSEPWAGACGVFHPLITEAVIKFQAETMMETFPASGPVKTEIIGESTRETEASSVRVQADMNYQLTEKMPEYRSEHERLLWSLPAVGSAFKKVYYDPSMKRPAAMFIAAEDVIVSYGCSSLSSCPRMTHRMKKYKNEVKKLQYSGFYLDIDLGEPVQEISDVRKRKNKSLGIDDLDDDRHTLLEMQVELDLKGFEHKDGKEETGIALPYVVTIDKSSAKIVSIYRNWKQDDDTYTKRDHFVQYNYIPGDGFYGYGLIHLVGGFAKAGTSILRQLVDAGTLSNLPGGLKAKGLRIKGDDTPIMPGEWRDVDIPGGKINENILPLPYKEPSATLYNLFNTIIEEGRNFATMQELQASDMNQNAPVGTTLAILERTLKVMSAVNARTHESMKVEFRLLKEIIREHTPKDYEYPNDGVKQADYDTVSTIPVSDPNASTTSQRIIQYQAALQLSATAPQIYDLPELHKGMLNALNIKDVDKIIPTSDTMTPKDPVSENMAILVGKPVRAFIYQDHDAHITVIQSLMQDPMLAQSIGQNPQAQIIMAAAYAHLNEHLAYKYRRDIEKKLGVSLPGEDDPLPEDVEIRISQLAAQAGQQLLQEHQQQAQQAAAKQDPVVQANKREQELAAQELTRKTEKDKTDADLKRQEIENKRIDDERKAALEKERIASQEKIAGTRVGAEIANAKRQEDHQKQIKGVDIGIQIASDARQKSHDKHMESFSALVDHHQSKQQQEHEKQIAKLNQEKPDAST